LRLFSFGGYELALAALALVVFGAYYSYPIKTILTQISATARKVASKKQPPNGPYFKIMFFLTMSHQRKIVPLFHLNGASYQPL